MGIKGTAQEMEATTLQQRCVVTGGSYTCGELSATSRESEPLRYTPETDVLYTENTVCQLDSNKTIL